MAGTLANAKTSWVRRALIWVLVQPVHLTDGAETSFFASPAGEFRQMSITRKSVSRFLVAATQRTTYIGKSVALSAA
jgi:NAD(P)H-binding